MKHTTVLDGGCDITMSQHTEVPGVNTFVSKQHQSKQHQNLKLYVKFSLVDFPKSNQSQIKNIYLLKL